MMKQYNSFEEIDTRLKILNLNIKIDKESLKLNLKRSKIDLKCLDIFEEFNSILQKKISTWLIRVLIKIFRKD
jgi:hypothetical protein